MAKQLAQYTIPKGRAREIDGPLLGERRLCRARSRGLCVLELDVGHVGRELCRRKGLVVPLLRQLLVVGLRTLQKTRPFSQHSLARIGCQSRSLMSMTTTNCTNPGVTCSQQAGSMA